MTFLKSTVQNCICFNSTFFIFKVELNAIDMESTILKHLLISGLVLIFFCAAHEQMQADSADPVLALIQEKYGTIESLTADFTQSFRSKALKTDFVEEGRLFIKMPGQMRWEYEKPEEKIAICNLSDSWLYMKEDNLVIKGSIGDSDSSRALLSLLTGAAEIEKYFSGKIVSDSGTAIVIDIRMKMKNDEFDHLVVTIDRNSRMIRKIEAFDLLGNVMTYSFRNIRENVKIKPGIFQFAIPPGARIKFQ